MQSLCLPASQASREAETTASSSSRKGAATRLMAGVSILDVPEDEGS